MSILLETLNRQENEQAVLPSALPNVHSSHYDDEMLGDEWLYQRLNKWRLVSLLLLLALIGSWGYFLLVDSNPYPIAQIESQSNLIVPEKIIVPEKAKNTEANIEAKETSVAALETNALDTNTLDTLETAIETTSKQAYVPQKRLVDKSLQQKNIAKPTIQSAIQTELPEQKIKQSNNKNFDMAIYKEELPEKMQQEFPLIAINSFVIAKNPEESFVILDGSFYKINQMIATNLILRQITSNHIVVEFQDRLVKIKLK